MSELVYSVADIFYDALNDNNCSKYYIAPYQRGYKWASLSPYDQVPQMLSDIYNAFKKNAVEYYLQYITIKKITHNNESCLELIDGQQRLTTLSILFHRFQRFGIHNITEDKLIYFRYEGQDIDAFNVLSMDETEVSRHQDLTYMQKAALCMDDFISLLNEKDEFSSYVDYLCNHVKIIFNLEDEFTSSEEVFENLNSNKVDLSNEHLVKGLLLTNAVVRKTSYNRSLSYKEILDQRIIMGRLWDEISAWISNPRVSHFFFAKKKGDCTDGLDSLLRLVLDHFKRTSEDNNEESVYPLIECFNKRFDGAVSSSQVSKYELFNSFNKVINSAEQAISILNELKHAYRVLYNVWMGDNKFFNLLGYVRFSTLNMVENSNWVYELIWGDRTALKKMLASKALEVLPDMNDAKVKGNDYKCLEYSSRNVNLTRLLLSFSVFATIDNKFDFFKYDKEKWTFEHLSPQNPKSEIIILSDIKKHVIQIINNLKIDDEEKQTLVEKINNDEPVSTEKLGFLYDPDIEVHSVGNMALLGGGDNSSVSNNPFIIKRSIIINRHNNGSFVPSHTINVYGKSLDVKGQIGFTPDFLCWSQADINAHKQWMINKNREIRNYLQQIKDLL